MTEPLRHPGNFAGPRYAGIQTCWSNAFFTADLVLVSTSRPPSPDGFTMGLSSLTLYGGSITAACSGVNLQVTAIHMVKLCTTVGNVYLVYPYLSR